MLHDAGPVPLEFAPLDVLRSTSPLQRMCHCPWQRGLSRQDSSAGQQPETLGETASKK